MKKKKNPRVSSLHADKSVYGVVWWLLNLADIIMSMSFDLMLLLFDQVDSGERRRV